MIGNLGLSTARHRSAALGKCYSFVRRVLLCFSVLASVAAGLSAVAKDAPNTVAGAQDALAPGKRPHTRQHVNARLPPYQAVGGLIGPMACTGAIVLQPRIVVTAAHCITGMTAADPSRRVSFEQWSPDGIRRYDAAIRAIGSRHQTGPQSIHDASEDWAILLLNEAPPGVRPLDIAELTLPELQSRHGRISLPTYARDGGEGSAVIIDPSCSIQDLQWEVLVHDCVAGATGLGAPLLIDDSDCYRVIGIHSGRMLRDVDGGLKVIGNSAVGSWNFAGAARKLAELLEADQRRTGEDGGRSYGCSLETAGLPGGRT